MLGKKKTKTIKEMLEERQIEEKIRNEISKSHDISDNTKIIVEKKSKIISILLIMIEIIKIFLKVILIIIVCILSTIGGTVLFNSALRDFFLTTVNIPF